LRKNRENSIQRQLELEMAKSGIAKNRAQAASLLTKSRDKNVEASIKASTPPEGAEAIDPRITEGEVTLLETEKAAKEAEIRRKEEAHDLAMRQKRHMMWRTRIKLPIRPLKRREH
jgi:hypothetical protein